MQQRRTAAGRPSGTDGSDFSYRMAVDSRYTKVAREKSRLKALIAAQGVLRAVQSLLVVLALQEKGFKNLAVVAISVGFVSILIGELGRRYSQVVLLTLYLSLSSVATAFTVVHIIRSDFILKVTQDQDFSSSRGFELGTAGSILLDVLLQIITIISTIVLVQNMSPKRISGVYFQKDVVLSGYCVPDTIN